tara:strand:- start:3974 stop:4177 length:204 start_codon:yes stop_codon:yes gene_type:complete
MEEIWKKIEDFPNYEISNLGNLRKNTGKIFNFSNHKITSSGISVMLTNEGRSKGFGLNAGGFNWIYG